MTRSGTQTAKRVSCKKFTRKNVTRFNVDLSKDTRVMMMYIAYRRYSASMTPEEILRDATGYLGEEHYMFGMELKAHADCEGLRRLSMAELTDIVRKSTTKKYKERPSPPFPAGPLCGYMLEGNDRRVYKSARVGKSCAWQHVDLPMPYK
jgi:hypothetical protein